MNLLEVFVQPLWKHLALVLVHFLWQGLAVAAVAVALVAALRLRHGSPRYVAYVTAFVVLALCPVVTYVVLPRPGPAGAMARSAGFMQELGPEFLNSLPANDAAIEVLAAPVFRPAWRRWTTAGSEVLWLIQPWAVMAWLAGAMVLNVRVALGLYGVWRLRRSSTALPEMWGRQFEELSSAMRVRATCRASTWPGLRHAVVTGLVWPMVLVPVALLTELPPHMLRAMLAHELAHVRRYDLWVNLLQRLVEALLFYHPAVWWLSRKIRQEREICCDEAAVAVTGSRLDYAQLLARVGQARQPILAAAAGAFAGRPRMHLLARIQHVLGPRGVTGRGAWPAGLASVLVLLAAARFSWVRVQVVDAVIAAARASLPEARAVSRAEVALRQQAIERGNAALWLGRYDKAVGCFEAALRHDPSYADAHLRRGWALQRAGRVEEAKVSWERAVALCTRALRHNPYDGSLYRGRAWAQRELGQGVECEADLRRAVMAFTRAIHAKPDATWNHLSRAMAMQDLGLTELVRYDLRQELAVTVARDPGIRFWIGNFALQYGYLDVAKEAMVAECQRRPELPDGWLVLGRVQKQQKDFDGAVASLNKAIELAPRAPEALVQRGLIYYERGDYAKAIPDFDKALRLQPSLRYLYTYRGPALYYQRRYQEAVADLTEAIRDYPQSSGYYGWRANAYLGTADYAAARDDASRAIEIDPQDATAYHVRAAAFEKLGDLQGALADMNAALAKDPGSAAAYYDRSRLQGDPEALLADLNRAIEIEPSNPAYTEARMLRHWALGHDEAALADAREHVKLCEACGKEYARLLRQSQAGGLSGEAAARAALSHLLDRRLPVDGRRVAPVKETTQPAPPTSAESGQ